ncbi:hypothetical protein [Chitinophaga qingshengii]|uniref:SprT-like domain-containing protein n=1 Tax=Chitinophaga qingshengii TaxID=1569794 RepID=A0ABR7TQU5_9BACT|nr:hypothetical protein [Chitinophaga qingshengii]MBC9932005.1 hypothetical protein [Chitinophaga qingshengii]
MDIPVEVIPPATTVPGSNSVTDIIKTGVSDPCMLAAIDMALADGLQNTIAGVFNQMFAGTDEFTIEFHEGDLPLDVSADTRTASPAIIEITLNRLTLPGSSREYIVATILHEAIHAMYDAKWNLAGRPKVIFSEYVQHNLMASKYVEEMNAALRSIFPMMSDADAIALAWGGLYWTTSWSALNPTVANNYLLAIAEYDQNHTKGNRCR